LGDFADSVTNPCHLPLCFDFVNIENAPVLASRNIGIIVPIAFAGVMDMGDIADKPASPRLDDAAAAPGFYPPSAPAKVQPFIDRPKGYFGFLTS
jgi:hypothetical protein